MRTTIELKDEHRAALLERAARRKEKGFSNLIGEAVELYLNEIPSEPSEEAKQRAVRALRGSLSKKEAEAMRRRIREIRSSWR